MNLSVFEWGDAVQNYNQEFGTEIATSETFGFKSLAEDQLFSLGNALESMRDASMRGTTGSYEQVSKKVDRHYQKYNKEREQWYESMLALFDSAEYWDQLIKDAAESKKAKKEMKKMKAIWQLQSGFSTLSSDAVYNIVSKYFPIVNHYIKSAETELRRKKTEMPKQLHDEFKAYISDAANLVHQFERTMIDIMLVRLKVASESYNWAVDDVPMFVAKRIDKNGLLDAEHKRIFPPKLGFNKEVFDYFIDYVVCHGSNDQRLSLSELEWFSPNKNYKKIQRRKEVFLVPNEIAQHVPRFYFSKKLFSQRYFRHHFFEERKWLMCRLKTLHTHTKVPKRLTVAMAEKLFADLCDLEANVLSTNEKALSKKVTNWRRIFHKTTNAFADACSRFTYAESQRLAEKKLEVIHVMRIKMQMDLEGVEQVNQYMSQPLLDRVNQLCETLDQSQIEQMCSEELLQRFMEDKAYFNNLYDLCEQRKEVVSEESDEESSESSTSTEDVSSSSSFDSSEEVSVAMETIKARGVFEATAKVELVSLNASNFDRVINALNEAVKDMPNKNDDAVLKEAMLNHFIVYLECCNGLSSKTEFEEKRERIEKIEQLLLEHAPSYVRKRVGELVEQRDGEESSWFGFKMLCEIFLQSCTDSDMHSASLN